MPNAITEKGAGAAAFSSCMADIASASESLPTAGMTIADQEKKTPALAAAPTAAAIVSQSRPAVPRPLRAAAVVWGRGVDVVVVMGQADPIRVRRSMAQRR